MTLLLILAVLSTAVWAYALVHALRHDPRRPDQAAPRSHAHESSPEAWYAVPPRHDAGRWAA